MKTLEPISISLEDKNAMEKYFKERFPYLDLVFSPAFRHYYINNTITNTKSNNISLFELYTRFKTETNENNRAR